MNNFIVQKLCQIINQYGRYIYNDSHRCESLIRDFCSQDKKARNLILTALREKIPGKLMSCKTEAEVKLKLGQLAQQLQDDTGITRENAQWAVETWALALQVSSIHQPKDSLNQNPPTKTKNINKYSPQSLQSPLPNTSDSNTFKPSHPPLTPQTPINIDRNSLPPPPPNPHNPTAIVHATFVSRGIASLIDLLILNLINILGSFANGNIWQNSYAHIISYFIGLNISTFLLYGWIYTAVMESSKIQATVGKLAMGIIVTNLRGKRISFAKASQRHYSKFLSFIILGIGFIFPLFTPNKQALHDKITGCLVVKKQ